MDLLSAELSVASSAVSLVVTKVVWMESMWADWRAATSDQCWVETWAEPMVALTAVRWAALLVE